MKGFVSALATAAVVAFAGSAAVAATFDIADSDRWSTSSFSVTSDGLTMTVSGGYYYSGYSPNVWTAANYGLSVGDHLVDTNEYAHLSFSEDVTLESFYAGYVDRYDDYRIYAQIGSGYQEIQSGGFGVSNYYGGNWDRATVWTDGDAGSIVARNFVIGVDDRHDEFKIRSVTAERIAPVPLPASAVLLVGALGMLGLRRRKTA